MMLLQWLPANMQEDKATNKGPKQHSAYFYQAKTQAFQKNSVILQNLRRAFDGILLFSNTSNNLNSLSENINLIQLHGKKKQV